MFMKTKSMLAVGVLCAALGGGCGGTKKAAVDASSCDAIGAKLILVMHDTLDGLKDRNRKIMESRIQLIRDEYVKACKRDSWPQAARDCHVQAKNLADFTTCGKGLAPALAPATGGDQPGATDMGPASEPVPAAPAPAEPAANPR